MNVSEKICAQCSIPCDMKCSKCAKVWYCGVEHQKLHRKTHKDNCFPAIELTNDRHGHYLASTRKILAGELIFTERPLLVAPFASNENPFPVCLGCCEVLPGQFGFGLNTCRKCAWPLCRQDCDQIPCHSENECKIFQAQKVIPRDVLLLPPSPPLVATVYECVKIIRILLLKESDPDKFDKFLQLESHEEYRAASGFGVLETNFTIMFIHTCCKMSRSLYSIDLINKLLGVVLVNSLADNGTGTGTTGSRTVSGNWCDSIYEKGSKLSHNCISNTKSTVTANNSTRRLFAATEIERNEILTECYGFGVNFWRGIVERRHGLHEVYHFWCSCRRCSDPTELGTYFSAIKCKGKDCSGFYLPANPLSTDGDDSKWICTSDHCKNTEKYSKLSKTVLAIQDEIEKSVTFEEKLNIIQKHANVSVHENHFTLMKLRYDLLPGLVHKLHFVNEPDMNYAQICAKTVEYAGKCLEIANKLAPGLSIHRGHLLFYLVQGMDKSTSNSDLEPMSKLKALEESRPFREEAKQILGLMPGGTQGHGFYKTLVNQEKRFSKGMEMLESMFKSSLMGVP